MTKTFLFILIALVVVVGGFYALNGYIYKEKQAKERPAPVLSYKDATYVVDGTRVKLENGFSEIEASPGSASKIVTRYFGNEVTQDLDGDGREDIVFLLIQEGGGTGVFFYVVAALNKEAGYEGSHALFLGDRIAPQTTEKGKGKIVIVNYAERAPDESFGARPSIGKSLWLILDT